MLNKTKKPAELRSKTIARSMDLMKYDAVNLADEEYTMGLPFFHQLASEYHMPMVSANIRIKKEIDSKWLKSFIIKNVNGVKVGITGVTPDSFFKLDPADKDKLLIDKDIHKALTSTVAEMKKEGADFVIALTHMSNEATRNYLQLNEVQGLSLAIGGHGRYLSPDAAKIKETYFVQNSASGEHIGVIRIRFNDKNVPVSLAYNDVTLSMDLPEDSKIAQIVKEFDLESIKIEEESRKVEDKAKEAEALQKVLNLKPEEFVKKMKGKEGQTVPLE